MTIRRLTALFAAVVMSGSAHAEAMHHTLIDFHSPSGICASLADAANFEDGTENSRMRHLDEGDLRMFVGNDATMRETFNKCMATVAPRSAIDPIPVFDSAKTCQLAVSSSTSPSRDLSDCLTEEAKDKIAISSLWNSVDAYARAECVLIMIGHDSGMPYMLLNGCLEGARDHKF